MKKLYKTLFGYTADIDLMEAQAKAMKALFEALKKEGFTDQQAFELTKANFSSL